jgi:hypothetical protein
MNQPPIPETAIVLEVIRLADADVRDPRRAAGLVAYDPSEVDAFESGPERDELLEYLEPLTDECKAGLYALYRLGVGPSGTAPGNANRYAGSYANAIQPCHRKHAAADLVAKGSLGDGLRRGLSRLGRGTDSGAAGETVATAPITTERMAP